ncbi:MAG: hypothetical protein IPH66_08505 [Crocinitomicaceae bacterium]|nr:hypothetical protein [Crocinitomicaceae bacterium]
MLLTTFIFAGITAKVLAPLDSPENKVIGHWKGIEMYQDENSYDGKTFYLPNSEEIIIEPAKLKVYFYPYFKTDEFVSEISSKYILCDIGKKKVKSEYHFIGDTLVLSMHFINKNFIKMYERVELDNQIITELDAFGFNPSSLPHEYELDTLHPKLKLGFKHYDSLQFNPWNYIQFVDDQHLKINRQDEVQFDREYQVISFTYKGILNRWRISRVEGTQQLSMIPQSYCECDSIHIPYMTVTWADRMRKKIEEEQY